MDWKYLFLRFDGRISRKPFWLANVALIVLAFGSMFLVGFLGALVTGSQEGASNAVFTGLAVASVVLIYCSLAISVKRLHDRDKSGWWMAFYHGVSAVQVGADAAGLAGTAQAPSGIGIALGPAGLGVAILYLVDLGILKGTQSPNRFGLDPLGATQADASL